MAQDPRLASAAEIARQETRSAVSSLRAMAAGINREHEQFRRERDRRASERAEAARRGELGPELQTLQRRIDGGETSWDDVLQGRDDHPSAQAARENMTRNLDRVAEQVRDDPDVQEAQAEAREAQERVERGLR